MATIAVAVEEDVPPLTPSPTVMRSQTQGSALKRDYSMDVSYDEQVPIIYLVLYLSFYIYLYNLSIYLFSYLTI